MVDPANDRLTRGASPIPFLWAEVRDANGGVQHRLVSPEHEVVRVPEAIARRIADVDSAVHDLKHAVECFERLATMVPPKAQGMNQVVQGDPESEILMRGLLTSGVISYARAFSRGTKSYVPAIEDVLSEPDDDDEFVLLHRKLLDLRSEFIAHSLGPFESETVVLVLTRPPAKREVVELRAWYSRLMSRWREDVLRWAELARMGNTFVHAELEAEKASVLAGIDIDVAYELPPVIIDPAVPSSRNRASSRRRRGK